MTPMVLLQSSSTFLAVLIATELAMSSVAGDIAKISVFGLIQSKMLPSILLDFDN
jgi:hypothetical protein